MCRHKAHFCKHFHEANSFLRTRNLSPKMWSLSNELCGLSDHIHQSSRQWLTGRQDRGDTPPNLFLQHSIYTCSVSSDGRSSLITFTDSSLSAISTGGNSQNVVVARWGKSFEELLDQMIQEWDSDNRLIIFLRSIIGVVTACLSAT